MIKNFKKGLAVLTAMCLIFTFSLSAIAATCEHTHTTKTGESYTYTNIDAQRHLILRYFFYKCDSSECGKSDLKMIDDSYNNVYGPHNFRTTYSMHQSGNSHYYSYSCSDCGYSYSESKQCNGNGCASIWSLPIDAHAH